MNIEDIKNPAFLKEMTIEDLEDFSNDMREFIIRNVSETGGHLSSNLGVVELTIAIHKVFDSPKNQIFFDVGHQIYIHKALTGRAKDFPTLRQFEGMSGFANREESEHDVWESGHASTSLSGALGYSKAQEISGIDEKVVVVIGDASIGGGLAFEALNHIGEIGRNVIIILNDNEMSISKPVGGLAKNLSKIRVSTKYSDFKTMIRKASGKSKIGLKFVRYAKSKKDALKRRLYKDGYFFDNLGIKYYGPIDGHDYSELLDTLEFVKNIDGPVLIHAKTKKGKGYSFAEDDEKGIWHGVNKFDVESGKVEKSLKPTHENWSNIIIWTIEELAITNDDIVVLTPAMENGSMLKKFKKKFPNRYFDVGIAEEHATTMCAGLSLGGMHPILTIYSTFLQRSYDQLLHDVCRMNARVVIGVDRSGLVGADGETHQGIYDVAYLKTIPNLVICMPRNADDAQHLLNTCIKYNGPIAIRYPRGSYEYNKLTAFKEYSIGKWEYVLRGDKTVIITYGPHVDKLVEYAMLNGYNISVINARFIKPIDEELLSDAFVNYEHIIVYEEVVSNNNLYTDIAIKAHEQEHATKITSFCLPDGYIEHGDVDAILKKYEMDYDSVFSVIEKD